jgi:malate synthase
MFATREQRAHPVDELQGAEDSVLTVEACAFIRKLGRAFEQRRQELLAARRARQAEIDAGKMPDFLPETAHIREKEWRVAALPPALLDRRVEITGPVERKMIINAMNSGANVFMADFEDSNSPTWNNLMEGQANLRDAVRRTITYTSPEGKLYKLCDSPALLMVRPRGWHLDEAHFTVDEKPISASLFDFGLFWFHNARTLVENFDRPCFYLPKLESHLEARLWNDVFVMAQKELGIRCGTIRATVLIETVLAAFEMDEILWELREHCAGLNCGRWDYIFSFIKKFRNHPQFLLPDRAQVTMDSHFLSSYVKLLIQTCHRRGAHAMGGMAAQIPIKDDPAANRAALERVRQDKLREVWAGHDGTWVAHPGLVPLAREVFDTHMRTPNQIARKRDLVRVTAKDLLTLPGGEITEEGLTRNIDVSLQYLAAWLRGSGCVPIFNLMEDAATAEISRTQVWQWVKYGACLNDGRPVTGQLVREVTTRQENALRAFVPARELALASRLLEEMVLSQEPTEFLTERAYGHLDRAAVQ